MDVLEMDVGSNAQEVVDRLQVSVRSSNVQSSAEVIVRAREVDSRLLQGLQEFGIVRLGCVTEERGKNSVP